MADVVVRGCHSTVLILRSSACPGVSLILRLTHQQWWWQLKRSRLCALSSMSRKENTPSSHSIASRRCWVHSHWTYLGPLLTSGPIMCPGEFNKLNALAELKCSNPEVPGGNTWILEEKSRPVGKGETQVGKAFTNVHCTPIHQKVLDSCSSQQILSSCRHILTSSMSGLPIHS